MDLSKLSDEDLEALSQNNYEAMSDEALEILAQQENIAPEPTPKREPRIAEAAIEGIGKGATLGYLPELQAAFYQAGLKAANLLGADLPDEDYQESLKAFETRSNQLKEEAPIASTLGETAGAMALPVPGASLGKAGSAIGRIGQAAARGALAGGVTGLAQRTDDSTKRISEDPIANLKSRLNRALKSAALGGAIGGGLQSGVELVKKAAPTLFRGSSGIPKNAIKTYIKRADDVQALKEAGPTAPLDIAEDVTNKVKNEFFQKKAQVGKEITENLKASGESISTDKIFDPLYEKLQELALKPRAKTPAGRAELEALYDFIESNRKGLPDRIDAETAFDIQRIFKQKGSLQNIKGTYANRYGANASDVEKSISDAALNAYRKTNDLLNDVASTAGLKNEYKNLSQLQDKLEKYFSDGEKTFKTLSGLEAPSRIGAKKTIEQLEKQLGKKTNLKDTAELLEAYRWFQDPELLPVSSGGTTSTSRNLSLAGAVEALGGIFGERGAQYGRALGNFIGGPMAVKGAIDTAKTVAPVAREITPRLQRAVIQQQSPWVNVNEEKK
jgi:hypothetical protein